MIPTQPYQDSRGNETTRSTDSAIAEASRLGARLPDLLPNLLPALLPTFALLFALAIPARARVLEVGPGKAYTKPSLAAAAAKSGDTVLIAAGIYSGDVCSWTVPNLLLRGVSQFAHMRADGANAAGKGTWVMDADNITVENIEFSGASVPDQNGAGIRAEGGNLTVRNCYFHGNENGILADGKDILIEYSQFEANGLGDGYTHNMYIGHIDTFTLRYCYTHHAKIGHNIKSRARKNYILDNRSLDGADGTASYELDLPNGGLAVIAGNVFHQGPATDNPGILEYGEEGMTNPAGAVQIINNTFVNDRANGGTFISLAAGSTSARVVNNLFVGPGTMLSGKADTAGNLVTQNPGFVNRALFDFRLTSASPAVDKGKDPGQQDGQNLLPTLEFYPPYATKARSVVGPTDIGAYEYDPNAGIRKLRGALPGTGSGAYPVGYRVAFDGSGILIGPYPAIDFLGKIHRLP